MKTEGMVITATEEMVITVTIMVITVMVITGMETTVMVTTITTKTEMEILKIYLNLLYHHIIQSLQSHYYKILNSNIYYFYISDAIFKQYFHKNPYKNKIIFLLMYYYPTPPNNNTLLVATLVGLYYLFLRKK